MAVTQPSIQQPGIFSLAGHLDRLPALWRTPASLSRDLAAILMIVAICAGTAWVGAVHTKIFGHDIFVLLDGGWRVENGQRPAVDFGPGTGTLLPLIMAAGLKLADNSVRGVGYASALLGAMVGLWSYAIARKRMPCTPAALISLLLTLIAVAPYPLGLLPNQLSHAMVYNRYGYALLGIVVLEAFQIERSELQLGALSTGVICAALLFLKSSFGLVGLVFAFYSVATDPRNRRRPGAILLGLALGILAMMAWLRFDFAVVWNTYRMLAAAKSSGLSWWEIRWAAAKGLPDFLWLALLAALVGALRSRPFAPLLAAILIMIGGALLLATNAQPGGYPLNAVFAILLAEQGRVAAKEHGIGASPGSLRADTVVILVGLLAFAPGLIANASGLAYAMVESRRNPPANEVARFQSAPLSALVLYDVPDGTDADNRSNGRVYVSYVNSGLELIREASKPGETVYNLDMFNPFSYALLRPPAHGGTDAIAFNHQFNDRDKPTPEWLFGSADIVMEPKRPSDNDEDSNALARNYLAPLRSQYRLCAENAAWQLYKRPSNLEGCPAVR